MNIFEKEKSLILFVCVDFVHSVSLTVHVTFEYHVSVTPKRRPRRLQTVQTEFFSFLYLVAPLTLTHFFGSLQNCVQYV